MISEQQFEDDFKLVFAVSKKSRQLSPAQMTKRIQQHSMQAARENQVVFKISSFSRSRTALGKTVNYNARKGAITLFDNMDSPLKTDGNTPLYHDFANEVQWLNVGQHKTKRLTMNFVLSLSEGTPKPQFEAATRDFLASHFGKQPYIYTFHNDTDHYHAHVVAGLRNYDGERIITDKSQLLAWRQGFADALRQQGLEAEATPALSRGVLATHNDIYPPRQRTSNTLTGNVNASLKARHDAWQRIHRYMKENNLNGVKELSRYINVHYPSQESEVEHDL